jgi:hypothetical protein
MAAVNHLWIWLSLGKCSYQLGGLSRPMFHVEHLQNWSSNNKKGQRRALAFLVFGALIEL